jgi:putative acyl-CoA dehydrogenase
MPAREPLTDLPTHVVANQPPPLCDYNLYDRDASLREGLHREGASWAEERVRALARELGSERVLELGEVANRSVPELRSFDRYGQRIDEVRYHPAYHALLDLGIAHAMPSVAWTAGRPGAHVAHVALTYLFSQVEAGVVCPLTMTYAVVPALRQQPELAAAWEGGILSTRYDPRSLPASEKHGLTSGMAMTEKQGGSDVRANTTRAEPVSGHGGGAEYVLTGHKWFCSAPMSDFFLTLAQAPRGLSCFLVPRWLPDGRRNRIFLQRLKDKLGNRSNASSEIEYDRAHAWMVGEEGRGVRTIIDMVHHTRNDTVAAPAAFMRQALVQAIHHARHRTAFGRRLVEQPLMRAVLADLALEAEAALALSLRIARSFDEAGDPEGRAFCRLATAVAKYWLNKRAPGHVVEALECLGGAGYVEESILPRLYREAPLNGIWEGSGNVICLDVLRAMAREPETVDAVLREIDSTRGADTRLDAAVGEIRAALGRAEDLEARARWLTESLAVALQASLLLRNAPTAVAEAFVATRLGPDRGRLYGVLPSGVDPLPIVDRAWPG